MSLSTFWSGVQSFFSKAVADPVKSLSMVVTLASAITSVLPNPAASGVLAVLHQVLDVIALNVGHNDQSTASTATINTQSS